MLQTLVTLPIRIGLRTAEFVLRRVGVLGPDEPEAVPSRRPTPEPQKVRPREAVTWDEPRASVPPAEPAVPPPAEPEPAHIEVEAELVAQVADPGAEGSPGPQLSVDEPWEGYSKMKAADIVDRLAAATPPEVAVVQLYESTHRARKTVLAA